MKKLSIALLLVVLLAGCAGNQNSASEDVGGLRVGMECDYAPFNWTQPESS